MHPETLFKLQNTLYTLNRCGLCLGTNLLSRYNNGKGKEKRLQRDSHLKMSSFLSLKGGYVVETSLEVFSE